MSRKGELKDDSLQGKYIVLGAMNKKYEFTLKDDDELVYKRKKLDIKIEVGNDDFTYVIFKNKRYPVELISVNQNNYEVLINNVGYTFSVETPISYKRKKQLKKRLDKSKTAPVVAPMPGKIVDILVENDHEVKAGEPLLVLEAMKMQNEITSHVSGKVKSIAVKAGDNVNKDDILVEIDK